MKPQRLSKWLNPLLIHTSWETLETQAKQKSKWFRQQPYLHFATYEPQPLTFCPKMHARHFQILGQELIEGHIKVRPRQEICLHGSPISWARGHVPLPLQYLGTTFLNEMLAIPICPRWAHTHSTNHLPGCRDTSRLGGGLTRGPSRREPSDLSVVVRILPPPF